MDELKGKKYEIILADPGWQYRDKALAGARGAVNKYTVTSDADIAALPVSEIAADDACLFLWVTMPKLYEAKQVIDGWGFRYKTNAFTWVKKNKVEDTWFWGMGHWTRSNAELCLLCTRGKPKRVSAAVHSVICTRVGEHSKKPAVARKRIVDLCGDLSRIELFARQTEPGWDVWGDETP